MNVMKVVSGLFFSGFVGCVLLALVMAVCAIALPWLYYEATTTAYGYEYTIWFYLSPLYWCSFATSGGSTSGECDGDDTFCDADSDGIMCKTLDDGEVAMAMYLIGCVAGCVGGIMALVDLCKNKRAMRIVAYVCFIAMFVLFIIGTAVFYSACDNFLDETGYDDVMWYSTGSSCGIVSIVMLVPACALYILFVVFRMKFGDN